MSRIKENIAEIRETIARYEKDAGRTAGSVKLLAVSKTFPPQDVQDAFQNAQQIMFGENRVQELLEKVPALPDSIQWHLIGHLQSNKAAKAAELADWIHSVDSEKLMLKLNAAAESYGKILNILLEINWTGEESKHGVRSEEDAVKLTELALRCKNLKLQGLMTMAEAGADEKRLRETFSGVRDLRDKLEQQFNISLPELSMGMSSDFREAILEGATMVRIGTAIFGRR